MTITPGMPLYLSLVPESPLHQEVLQEAHAALVRELATLVASQEKQEGTITVPTAVHGVYGMAYTIENSRTETGPTGLVRLIMDVRIIAVSWIPPVTA